MRRRKLLVALAGLAVVVAAGVVVLWPEPPLIRVTEENLNRVRPGMTRTEVEAILGPPGDYRTHPTDSFPPRGPNPVSSGVSFTSLQWQSDTIDVQICVAPNGDMQWMKAMSAQPTNLGPLDRLRWRAKRQWHRWFPE
jgi:hypothetical protein